MANKDDYLTEYRKFFENFAKTVNPHDQLPVKLACYKLVNVEVVGGIIDWTTQYLTQKQCPENLIAPLIKIVIEEIRKGCKKHPIACGFNTSEEAYEPLKLMQCVMAKTNEVCLRYLDNSMLCSLPSPGPPYNVVSVFAFKNLRRKMEDRHIVIHDLNTMFNVQKASPSSYYAIFDGHAGHDAAAYSSAHLHQFLAESKHFINNPGQALVDAFCKTDVLFLDKCRVEKLSSGTTAVCALLRPKEKTLYIAWVGDSQALLVNQGKVLQCVIPHKPSREDEKNRIEQQGGLVIYWGTWRVNGQLAVSRAIGDADYKPYVTATPDVQEIPLNGNEDFLILACDGLWDFLSEDDAAVAVYNMVCINPDDTESISNHLAQLAKQQGSTDNISVIVVFLREPSKVAADAHWANRNRLTMEAGLDNANATNNPFANSNGTEILQQKDGFLLNLNEGFKQNGAELSPSEDYAYDRPANGKRPAEEFDEDEDMGPETDVDTLDDALSPITEQSIIDNKNLEAFDPFTTEIEEKSTMELDINIQKQQTSEFEPPRTPREETPTPPAHEVHDAGVEENVAESGEDSEDEWNYYKGDSAESEKVSSSKADQEVAELTKTAEKDKIEEEEEAMSQLNPNAAEFVPISSPTRNVASPACRALLNDQVIAQSPRRATPSDIDINLPNPQDFEKEVKKRPSDVFSNGQENDNNQKLTSQEVMENLLNGRNIEEIEFHPSTPVKATNPEEFHFGPNATPFSTPAKLLDQSEAALSTKAVFGDESTASYLEEKTLGFESSFTTEVSNINPFTPNEDVQDFQPQLSKTNDPMSMSFYQDESDANPFDLNKVQMLPDDDDFLDKPENNGSFMNETMSDLPEHDPLGKAETIVTDLDKPLIGKAEDMQDDSNLLYGVSKLPETPEPAEKRDRDECIERQGSPCDLPPAKSPILMEASKAPLPITPEPNSEEQDASSAPKTPEAASLLPEVLLTTKENSSPVSPIPPKSPSLPFEETLDSICDAKASIQTDIVTSNILEDYETTPSALSPEPTEELNQLTKSLEPTDDELYQQTFEVLNRPDSKSQSETTPEPTEELLCQCRSPEPRDLDISPVPITELATNLYEENVSSVIENTDVIQEEFFPICQKSPKQEIEVCEEESLLVKEEVFSICSKAPITELSSEERSSKLKIEECQDNILTEESIKDDIPKSPVPIIDDINQSKSPIVIADDIMEHLSKSPISTTDDIVENISKSPLPMTDIEVQSNSSLEVNDNTEIKSKLAALISDQVEIQSKSDKENLLSSPVLEMDIEGNLTEESITRAEDIQIKSPEPTYLIENQTKSSEITTEDTLESQINALEPVVDVSQTIPTELNDIPILSPITEYAVPVTSEYKEEISAVCPIVERPKSPTETSKEISETLELLQKLSLPETGDTEVCRLSEAGDIEVCRLPEAGDIEVCRLPQAGDIEVCRLPEAEDIEVCRLPEAGDIEVSRLPEAGEVEVCRLPEAGDIEVSRLPEAADVEVCRTSEAADIEVCRTSEAADIEVCRTSEAAKIEVCRLPKAEDVEVCRLPEGGDIEICRLPDAADIEVCIPPEGGNIEVCGLQEGGDSEVCKQPENLSVTPETVQSSKEMTHNVEASEQMLVDEIQNILDTQESVALIECEAKSPETIEESLDSEKRDLESPIDDITSSVKDDNSLTPEIIEEAKDISNEKEIRDSFMPIAEPGLETLNINYAQGLSNVILETNEMNVETETVCQISSTPNTTISEHIDTESINTADVNSFLERSNMPEVTSPLSPSEQTSQQIIDLYLNDPLSTCVYPLPTEDVIKTDVITPQYTQETVITPSEETKMDTPTPAVEEKEAPVASSEVALEAETKENVDDIILVAAVGATATAATVAAVATVTSKEKKPAGKPLAKATPTAKKFKPGQLSTRTSLTKQTATKISATVKQTLSSPTKPLPPKTTRTPSTPKPAPATSKSTSKVSPKSKIDATTPKSIEKKPLMNGDIKAPTRTSITKKPLTTTTRSSIVPKTPLTPKSSPTKTEVKTNVTKVSSVGTKVTSSSSSTLKSTTMTKTTTAALKPRPTSLTSKTTGSSSTAKTTTVSATKTTAQSKTTITASSPKSMTAKPKPPTSLTSKPPGTITKPRVSVTKVPSTKGPDTEKQIKDSVNKQLTVSRTTTAAKTIGTLNTGKTTTTIKKTEVKSPSTRTTTTKTTTTIKSMKKPTEITRGIAKKTAPTKTAIKTHEIGLTNGITTIVQETTTILSTEPQLIKDLSPIENKLIIDNSQLSETNVTD